MYSHLRNVFSNSFLLNMQQLCVHVLAWLEYSTAVVNGWTQGEVSSCGIYRVLVQYKRNETFSIRVLHVPVHNEQLLCTCGESTTNWQLHMHLTACQLVGGMLTINFAKFTASCAITLCKFTVYVYKFTQPIVIVHVLFSLQASSHKARVHRQRYKTETKTHGTVCTLIYYDM